MAKTIQLMQSKTPLIIVLLGSILFGLLSFFGYSPDPKLIGDTINYADQAQEAISMKNWIALATVLISAGAAIFSWWKGKSSNRQTLSMLLLLFIGLTAASARLGTQPNTVTASIPENNTEANSTKITIVKPLPRIMDFVRRC